ncbi:hypothetical protein JYP52_01410 [Nitratireductor aquibiodomus]|uniref:hypothetical protein n=1 Tax=Nitratireductor aquibiodomus TaxID=204799 RepID=UPI0019D33AD4|nr:hypothetical protein [Nitratireductor aquibiodomus]MBN7759780.1 hypothetical protein [Nitratireductor aquibiodomus]
MPRSAKVTTTLKKNGVTVHIGRSYAGIRSNQTTLAEALADELEKTIRQSSHGRFFKVRAVLLAQQISHGIDVELRKVGAFIGSQMIGRPSGRPGGSTDFSLQDPHDDDGLNAIKVQWRNLSLSTIRKKSKNGNRFFLHNTDLKRDIRANVGSNLTRMVNAGVRRRAKNGEVVYGPVRITPVYNAGGSKYYRIGHIEVDLFKGSRLDKLRPVLDDTVFSSEDSSADIRYLGRVLGLSADSITKLVGAHGREQSVAYRPLLEPAIAYFLLNRVPGAVSRVLRRHATRGG